MTAPLAPRLGAAGAVLLLLPANAHAIDAAVVRLDELQVTAPGGSPVPTVASPRPSLKTALSPSVEALPASTTVIDAAEIARLPVRSYGDLLRPVAGFDVSNYGQGGVGYGIALRGFTDAEHGRDIAFFVDGVPINEVSSIHTLAVQNLGRSRRDGFEIEAKFLVYSDGLDRIANYAGVTARLLNGAPAVYVPNVPATLATAGAEFDLGAPVTPFGPGRVTGSAYLSFIGAKPLTEDGLLRSSPYPRLSGRLAYGHASGWTACGQATLYPGDRTSESVFNFGSAVTATAADIHTSPQPRLTLLAGLSYGFTTGGLAR